MLGGTPVNVSEFVDLANMMERTELYDMDSKGDEFTWSNKQQENPTYTRIDRVMANVSWFQQNLSTFLFTLDYGTSHHAMIFLKEEIPMKPPKHNFKFMNSSITLDGFHEKVRENWNMHMEWGTHEGSVEQTQKTATCDEKDE